jgi:alkylhydroperoxidase family enzyme
MISCCSIVVRPYERDRMTGESDERILAVAGGRGAPFCTDAERAALALTTAFARLSDRADRPSYPDSPTES